MLVLESQGAASLPVMLVIGDLGRWKAMGRTTPRLRHCHFCQPADLNAELLDRLKPDYVVSALIGGGVDAMEIAERLTALSFAGAYRAIVSGLPNLSSVRAEIRSAAPEIDFDIYVLPEFQT